MTSRKLLRFVAFAFSLFLIAGTGCHRAPDTPEKAAKSRLAWNLETTVEAYDKIGVKSSQWDQPARECLKEFARTRAPFLPSDEPYFEIISTNVTAAVDAGCTDPMVSYLFIRFAMPKTNSKVAFADRYYATFKLMNESSYPPIRKFYTTARAIDQYYYAYGSNVSAHAEINEMVTVLFQNVADTMEDKTIPSAEASEVSDLALQLTSGDSFNQDLFYDGIEKRLSQNMPNDYLPWYLKGKHYIELGWRARGGGYADSVTKEGWASLGKNLAIARESLEHAWKLNPKESKIALQMMTVTLGQGGDRGQLELWFNRAMEVDTNNYYACHSKLYFLEPKWYGSDEEELAFGRECVQSTKWGGQVSLTLVDAHVWVDSRLEGAAKTNYWKQPEVWSDLQAAYDRFFELNPSDTGYYHDYARYAYRAEQWDKLNELIPKLGTPNYEFFGGKAEFDKMVRLANEHK